jgi:Tfp pilus assembly protein FimT
MNSRGITLIELLVVISAVAILFIAMGFSFIGWEGQYSIESQIKVLYDDLMEARAQAMQRNRAYFVTVASTGYKAYEDTNPPPDGNGTLETGSDTEILDEDLKETMTLEWNGDSEIEFTQRGMSNDRKTLCIII